MVVRPDTVVAHDEGFPAGAVVPPIFQTSLFTFASYRGARGQRCSPHPASGGRSTRAATIPTVAAFETKLAALEGAEDGTRLCERHGSNQRCGA